MGESLDCIEWIGPRLQYLKLTSVLFHVAARLVQSQNPWSMKIYGIW